MRIERRLVRRTVALYLLGIVLPAIGLLYLAWRSMQQQRAAIDALTDRNTRLQIDRVGTDLEARVAALASACAHDEAFRTLGTEPRDANALESARRTAEGIRRRHPVAAHVLFARAGEITYPLARDPLLADVSAIAGPAQDVAATLSRAEALEGNASGDVRAVELYREVADAHVAPRMQALALARLARCDRRLGRVREASLVWARLSQRYADERDPALRPYGLLAALEQMEDDPRGEALRAVRTAYDELLTGRWDLSPDQVDYFLPLLEARLGRQAADRPASGFLAAQRFAVALRDGLPQGAVSSGSLAWARLGSEHPFVVALSPAGDGVAGCALDVGWVATHVLPSITGSTTEIGTALALQPRDELESGGHATLAIRSLNDGLAGYRLVATRTPTASARGEGGAWAFAGATLVTMTALSIGVLLLLRDVARQRETNHIREDLVSGVSHELKTPLTLIRVYAETLAADPAAAEEDRRTYYDVIVRETERLGSLIERVLNFSRVDRGERTYRFKPVDLAGIVGETARTYREFLRTRGFTLEVDIAPGVPVVTCDADAVAEALVNLIDNAANYSGDAREIAVSLRHGAGVTVVIEVEDHGIGIDRSEIGHVFERFYRGKCQSGRGGYGLGLFLVKHTAEAHGGRVEVDSVPGAGSRFRIVLPTTRPTA
jgi:signal transduction histidine kinase